VSLLSTFLQAEHVAVTLVNHGINFHYD